jgi:PAS domain S-box-containing protein
VDEKKTCVNNESEKPPWSRQQERAELLEQFIESATDFAILTADAEGLITSWNVGGERLVGYSESEILGKSGDVIFAT